MRNKWTGLLPKLLRRVLMSVHAALNRQRLAAPKTGRGPHADAHTQGDLAGVFGLKTLFNSSCSRSSSSNRSIFCLTATDLGMFVLCTLPVSV